MTILRRHYTMNWQENFTTKVLERGFEYYENGNILEIMNKYLNLSKILKEQLLKT